MSVKFEDNHIKVEKEMKEGIIAFLHEAGGAVKSATQRNSSVGKIGGGQTKGAWDYVVDESKLTATIGNPQENAIWEEFGTGEYALEGNGRKGKWYIPIGSGSNEISETVVKAYGMKVVHGKEGKMFAETSGKRPKRSFNNAFESKKTSIKHQLESILKGLNND